MPKYALLENERRFLVLDPPDLSGAPARLIEDRYLEGRLRLRRITHADGQPQEFKLCKKYGSDDPCSAPIVNIYLTESEHGALAALPGLPLVKRRYRVVHDGRPFSVDVFEGALTGLVLCEKEADSAAAIRAVTFPPWAIREVTADRFFAGGNLCRITADELVARLSELRLEVEASA
ncbi:MAG TPA: hypothetical protein VME40_13775 [Caulobacteraceae bacterium]|nr:hypothetical protein [Caulobacteraceae bacterium]